MTKALIILFKNPILGRAKTRLAKDIGDEAALEIYQNLLSITKETTSSVEALKLLFYSDFIDTEDDWRMGKIEKQLQSKGDLGQRMETALEYAFEKAQHVLIMGSDCPEITPDLINHAFDVLNHSDIVIGPSEDGGYYLLGMQKWLPELVRDKPWSTDEVLMLTLSQAIEMGNRTYLLPPLNDIDTLEDWNQWKA